MAKAKAYELNDKQLRFVEEYWLDANATQAAIRAGYSEKTASSQGYDLLKKPEIRARIEEKRKNLADWVRSQLLLLASSSVEHYKLENGKLTTTEDAPLNAMQAVSSLKIKERTSARTGDVTVEAEFKLWSKDRALENLGKHLAMFTEKQQISGDPDNPTPAVMLYLPRNGKTADEQ